MGRTKRNELTLIPLANGHWRLYGYFNGERVRMRAKDFTELEAEKIRMEARLVQAEEPKQSLRHTWLTAPQLRDAEAAVERAGGRSVLECVFASERTLPPTEAVPCATALAEWIAVLTTRKRYARTIEKNRLAVTAFLTATKAALLLDVSPLMIERWVFSAVADYTKTTRAQVLRAFFRFCVKRRYLRVSPFEIDMADLSATAKPSQPARILEPKQMWSLFDAAELLRDSKLLPYTILTGWCFLRHAEAVRVTEADLRLDAKLPIVIVRPRKRATVSYREVSVPKCILPHLKAAVKHGELKLGTFFSRSTWDTIRDWAGLLKRTKTKNGRRKHIESEWQENLLRHTGISYYYQRTKDIKETCREAGNSDDTAFRHYLSLPKEGSWREFYRR